MQDNTLLTVCTKNEYNNLLTVSTKTKAVFLKTEFFLLTVDTRIFPTETNIFADSVYNFFLTKVFFHYSRWIQKVSIQIQDNTLLTVCTKNEYNILLTVSTKTKAVCIKTIFLYSQWILNFFQLKLKFLLRIPNCRCKTLLRKKLTLVE